MPMPRVPGAHRAVMEAQEVQALTTFGQVHDPGLRELGLKAQARKDRLQRLKGVIGFPAVLAHRHEIVGITDQHPNARRLPLPVEPVKVDVGEQRRDHAALRGSGRSAGDRAVLHDAGAQHAAHQVQEPAVDDTFLDGRRQTVVRDRLKTAGDVRLDHPLPAPPCLVDEDLEGVVRRLARAKPERARQEVRFKDRLEHDPRCGLHDAITHRRDRQRPPLKAAGLRDEDPARSKRTVRAVPEVRGQLVKQPVNPVPLDIIDGLLVDAGRAAVAAHQLPRALQHVPAMDLVVKRVEPSPGIGLGRPVKRALQFSDPVYFGGPSHDRGTHQALPCPSRVNEAAALPSPAVVLSARLKAVLRPPPTPSRHPAISRPPPVIGRDAPAATRSATGPGRASPVPAVTIRTFHALYAEEFFGAAIQALHPFHGLHPTGRGSALPDTRSRRGRLRLMLRTARSHTPNGCLTLRFDPTRFPAKPAACYRASWQLPGPDLPRQATTSLSSNHDVLLIDLQQSGRTPDRRGTSAAISWVDGQTVTGSAIFWRSIFFGAAMRAWR